MRAKAREAKIIALPMGLNWWVPVGTGYNAKLHESYLALSNEWQAFVGRRVGEDLHLLQQIGTAKSVDQYWDIYTKFWQKAAEDYTHEYAAIAKLAATSVISVAKQALRASDSAPHLSKAA